MKHFIKLILIVVSLLGSQPSFAWTHGAAPPVGATGLSEANVPALTQTGYPFMNFMLLVSSRAPISPTAGFVYPSILDANGYPNNGAIPAGTSNGLLGSVLLPTSYGTGVWHYGFTSGSGFPQIQNTGGLVILTNSGCSVNGVANFTGTTSTNVTVSGTTCALTFTYVSGTPANQVFVWTSGTYTNFGGEYLVRDSDWANFQAQTQTFPFTPESIAFYNGLNLRTIRNLDWSGANNNIISRYAYQPTVTAASFNGQRFDPTCWGGTTTNTGDAYTAAQTPSGWTGFTQGATIQVQFNSANTTSAPTLTVNGTTKTITNFRGTVVFVANTITANSYGTLVYDQVQDVLLFINSGFTTSSGNAVPLPYRVAFANQLNLNFWDNIPILYDQASVTTHNTVVFSLLKSLLNYMQETTNELWNKNLQTGWAQTEGATLGFPSGTSGDRQYGGVYALKLAQHLSAARAVWGSSSRLIGIMSVGAIQNASLTGNTVLYRIQGGDLNGTTYPAYAAAGYPNYDGSGGSTTPAGYVQGPNNNGSFTYATYWSGSNAASISTNYTLPLNLGGPSGGLNTGLLGAADGFASGNPTNISLALSYMDWDARQGMKLGGYGSAATVTSISNNGTVTWASNFLTGNGGIVACTTTGSFDPAMTAGTNYFVVNWNSGTGTFQLSSTSGGSALAITTAATGTITCGISGDSNHGSGETLLTFSTNATGTGAAVRGVYPSWNVIAANFNLSVELYEGGYEGTWPSVTTCTGTLGMSTANANIYCGETGEISNLIQAYKASSLFQQTVTDQYTQFMTNSKSKTPSWYGVIANPSAYASNIFGIGANWALQTPDLFGTPFTSYNAIHNFHYPFLLKRDLDPASNDNSPMWLEKAA